LIDLILPRDNAQRCQRKCPEKMSGINAQRNAWRCPEVPECARRCPEEMPGGVRRKYPEEMPGGNARRFFSFPSGHLPACPE